MLFITTAIFLPIVILVGFGFYFIVINGYIVYFISFLIILSFLYFLLNIIMNKYIEQEVLQNDIVIPSEWSEDDIKVYEKLEIIIENKFKKDVQWEDLKEFSFELISHSAGFYKSKNWGDKKLSFSISESLMAIEELSNRYRGYIDKYIPIVNNTPISTLKLGYDYKNKLESIYEVGSQVHNVYRVARFINPKVAVLAEVKSFVQKTAFKGISSGVQNKAQKELMKEVACVSIDLYRGYFKKNKIKVDKMRLENEAEIVKERLEEEKKNPIKIALFGQPGAGKSSIINAIVGERVATVGANTDVTTEVQIIEHKGLIFVDLPGYGTSKFPQNEFFDKFDISDYDLFLNVFSGKFHDADSNFFQKIREKGKIALLVRNKCDDIWEEDKSTEELYDVIQEDARKHVKSNTESVIFTDARKKIGFDNLNKKIGENVDNSKKERWNRGAKAYTIKALEEKRDACKIGIHTKATMAALVNAVPVPGAGITADIGALVLLFKDIRENFGLTENKLKDNNLTKFTPIAKQVLEYGSKEGVILLLKQFSGREVTKEIAKWIPGVGTALASSISFGIIEYSGLTYVDDCYEVAKKILEEELKAK